jgi:carboxylesterase type B
VVFNPSTKSCLSGGGFDSGASSDPKIDGSYLAARVGHTSSFALAVGTDNTLQGIVFASYNYRLSLFGFPHASEITQAGQTQNFGLLDTRAAVEWLRDNVGRFGGDPNKITLGGKQSSMLIAARI